MHKVIRQTDVVLSGTAPLRRREFLKTVSTAATGGSLLNWSHWVQANASELRRKGKSCIVLWMQGGPSQFETFSPLPGHKHGGATKAVATATTGIQIAENLPQLADVMNEMCIIRSMTSKEGSHPRASYLLHTGYLPNPTVRHPALGAVAAQQLGDAAAALPSFVRIGNRFNNSSGGGVLGVQFDPLTIRDPHRPPENTTVLTGDIRLQRRLELLQTIDQGYQGRGGRQVVADHQKVYESAARMVLSSEMDTFDLQKEPAAMRQAYGKGEFASGCLLARRLVEAGVTFVEVGLGNWDSHQDNFNSCKELCGQLDQPMAQLIRDLKSRGMLEDTLIIWMGEFGRTPKINPNAGRDHYPKAFNVVLAGGGVRGGQVLGATDPAGVQVAERPVTVPDLFRTVCHLLGIDADRDNMTPIGRPVPVVEEGTIIQELLNA